VSWRPTASLENLKLRARILSQIRAFFFAREVLEVETPLLSAAASTDPYLDSFKSHYLGPHAPQGRDYYLQTSPEFAMKRLLAAGSGSIFQICKAFRNGECGNQHNPEFTMLEWYRPGYALHDLMNEVESLLSEILAVDSTERLTYRQLFLNYVGLDPFQLTAEQARYFLNKHSVTPPELANDIDDWLSLILTHLIEPKLGFTRPVFVYDFPVSQAMLARVRQGEPPVAERFELYVKGVELANGFFELADAAEQQQRFAKNLRQRVKLGLPSMPMDENFLAALESGLPDCSGVALGIDRLIMLAVKAKSIQEVMNFPIDRA
jgi:lysyl-tRNA synthetase class 2